MHRYFCQGKYPKSNRDMDRYSARLWYRHPTALWITITVVDGEDDTVHGRDIFFCRYTTRVSFLG